MDILSKKCMINMYLKYFNDSNNVNKIEANAGIKIKNEWEYPSTSIEKHKYTHKYTPMCCGLSPRF